MSDLIVKTFMSEQFAKLLNLCLDLEDGELTPQEAIEKILEITAALRQWL
jgi:Fe-S-cluster formation regulator IscX/YfhJ